MSLALRLLLLAACLLLLAAKAADPPIERPASTDWRGPYDRSFENDGWPPARFRLDRKAPVQFVNQAKLDKACGDPTPGFTNVACVDDNSHVITLPNPCSFPESDDYARIACHEIAHLAGWPHDHGS